MQANREASLAGLRVLLVAQYGQMGGTRTYTKQLVDFYLRQKVDLLVIRQGPIGDIEMDEYLGTRDVTVVDWELISTLSPRSRISAFSRSRLRRDVRDESVALRALAGEREIDIVVASVGDPGSLLGAMSALSRGIYILHTYPHGIRSRVLSHLLLPDALPVSSEVVTVSDYARDRIVKMWRLGNRSRDVHVLHTSVGPLTEAPSPVRESTVVLTMGHLEAYKDPLGWVDIATSVLKRQGCEGSQFVWAGDGSLLTECRKLVRRRGLQDRVHFVGMQRDVDALYGDCALYLQPSRVESLGLGVLDAARRGIPAVVSDVGGLPETVDSGHSGLVYPVGKQGAAVEAVAALLMNADRRAAMGLLARDHYRAGFSPQTWEAGLIDLHMASIDGTRTRAPKTLDSEHGLPGFE